MNALKPIWHDIALIWTFFTRIPAPHFMTDRTLSGALWALPVLALVFAPLQMLVLSVGWPTLVSAALLVALPIAVTGALHWDGLADVFDGFGVSRARRAAVMRDSALGAFGSLALVFTALIQVAAYDALLRFSLPHVFGALFCLHIASRAVMGLAWAILPALDDASLAMRLGRPSWIIQAGVITAALLVALVFGLLSVSGVLLMGAGLTAWFWLLRRNLDGISGDALGAVQVITETLFLLALIT